MKKSIFKAVLNTVIASKVAKLTECREDALKFSTAGYIIKTLLNEELASPALAGLFERAVQLELISEKEINLVVKALPKLIEEFISYSTAIALGRNVDEASSRVTKELTKIMYILVERWSDLAAVVMLGEFKHYEILKAVNFGTSMLDDHISGEVLAIASLVEDFNKHLISVSESLKGQILALGPQVEGSKILNFKQ